MDVTLIEESLQRSVEERNGLWKSSGDFSRFSGRRHRGIVTHFAELLRALSTANVGYILVRGVAAPSHGSPRATQDLDIVYRREDDNL